MCRGDRRRHSIGRIDRRERRNYVTTPRKKREAKEEDKEIGEGRGNNVFKDRVPDHVGSSRRSSA